MRVMVSCTVVLGRNICDSVVVGVSGYHLMRHAEDCLQLQAIARQAPPTKLGVLYIK